MSPRSAPQTADAEDAARGRAARLVAMHVTGRSSACHGNLQASLAASLSGAAVAWFEDVLDTATETAACELNPSAWDDGGLPLPTEAELAALIDGGVMMAFEDEDAPASAFGSGLRM